MSERAVIFDLPELKRYAIAYEFIKQHKWDKLLTGGMAWNEMPIDAFSDANLRLWMATQVTFAEFQQMVTDGHIYYLGNGSEAELSQAIIIDTVAIQDVPSSL